jgi:hypothetical protein
VYKGTRWPTYPGDKKWNKSQAKKKVKRKSAEEIEKWGKKVIERSRRTFYKGSLEVRQVRETGKSKVQDQTNKDGGTLA